MERQVTITATPSKVKTISVNKATVANEITATPDTSLYYSNLSKQWATKMDGLVVGEDYSSKYYAENARISAETAKMEASSVNGLIPELQENFNNYNSTLNETADNAITEINTNRDYAITQVNQTASQSIENVNNTANNAIDNIEEKTEGLLDNDLSNITQAGLDIIRQNGGSSLPIGSTVVLDKVLSFEESQGLALQGTYVYKNAVAGERYGYPDFYNEYVGYKNNATATQTTLGSSTITIYNNANGLKFYDIANKGVIDAFFNSTGVADFYGIDETNERIFLPRNKYFAVTGGVMGNGIAIGLTNNGTTGGLITNTAGNIAQAGFSPSVYGEPVGTQGSGVATEQNWAVGLTPDPTKSGITLEPNENKYLYYVVGNTVSDTSWVDVVTQVQGGVKDLEDKTQEGIERLNAIDALKKSQITNCITEIPQDIKLELNNGVLTLKAGSKVYVPNGVGVFDEVIVNSDIIFNFGTASGDNWFITVNDLATAQKGYYRSNQIHSGTTKPNDTTNKYQIWYDTTSNIIKVSADTGVSFQSGMSLPLGVVTLNQGLVTSIDQTFNGFGYIGSTVFVTKGVKGLIPNGRNEDGTLNNIECSFSKVVTQTNTVQYSGNIDITSDYFDLASGDYYDEETNYNRLSDGRIFSRCVAGKFVKGANGVITSFNTTQPFRAVDYSEFNSTPHITETYQNGTSGYIVYSNGYCEQWGIVSFAAGEAIDNGGTVTYLKPFKDTNYNGLASINNRPGFTKTVGMFSGAKTATSFSWGVDNEGGASKAGTFTWKVWGYIR